jgi:hypothetical protein
MKYVVEVVGDGELPGGLESVIVQRVDSPPLMLVSGSVARSWRMMREWEDTMEPSWEPTVTIPRQTALRLVV